MYLLDKLRVILHEEGDGLHQLRLSERRDLAGGGGRHSVVHQTGGRALSWSAAGESLERGEGLEIKVDYQLNVIQPQEREASLLCSHSPPAAPSPSPERTCG